MVFDTKWLLTWLKLNLWASCGCISLYKRMLITNVSIKQINSHCLSIIIYIYIEFSTWLPTFVHMYVKGEHDVLSNFYPCKLVYEGKTYNSAEHIYQSQKAQHHRLYAIDREIRRSRSAKQAKQISKSIRRQWMGR